MSSSIFFLIMIACCYPVVPVIVGILANEAKPKKNILIGVTLPKAAQEEEAVKAICLSYRKQLRNCAILLTAVLIPVFFIPSFSVILTVWLCWLLIAITLPYGVYIQAYKKLKTLKVENRWYTGMAQQIVVDVTVAAAIKKPISRLWFLPALMVSLIPLVAAHFMGGVDFAYGVIIGATAAGIVLLSVLFYPLIFRQKGDMVDANARINLALTNVRRYNWSLCWILLSWLTALFALAMWFGRDNMVVTLISICVYSLAAIALSLVTELRARKGQEKLSAYSGGEQYLDEDAFWVYGLFYNNPNDRHFVMNNRVGMGTTVNLARPGAKVLMGITALIMAALPFLGVWCIFEEYTPITVTATADSVRVQHMGFDLTVDYDDVKDAALLYDLPGLCRINGTGMDTVDKGKFSVEGYGTCRICLDPRADAFLVLVTADKTYLISTSSTEETEHIYQWVEADLNE